MGMEEFPWPPRNFPRGQSARKRLGGNRPSQEILSTSLDISESVKTALSQRNLAQRLVSWPAIPAQE